MVTPGIDGKRVGLHDGVVEGLGVRFDVSSDRVM